MAWFVYRRPPTGMWWEYLSTAEEIATNGVATAARAASGELCTCHRVDPDTFAAALEAAREIASMHGSEGGFGHEVRVFWLPGEASLVYAFALRQDSSGPTYVVSPRPLLWLVD
jgi:hypothetical protein